jgi:peptidoglycan/xylan/chitin deacetylase (PgdA/CDA1 family)
MGLMIIFAFLLSFVYFNSVKGFAGTNTTSAHVASCNCIVFRLDDVQDYWLNSVQAAVMNLFMSKNQSLSVGLITHEVGNDSKIVDKVKEGLHKGLFEIDLHGWDHVNYTELTEKQQKDSLSKANANVERLFGTKSIVFIPPYDVFNNDTIKAIRDLGIRIISSEPRAENSFDQNRSIFVAKVNSTTTATTTPHEKSSHYAARTNESSPPSSSPTTVYHLPATIFFKDFNYVQDKWIKIPLKDIIGNVTRNIAIYGYAVIGLHPQDFAKSIDGKENFTNSIVQKEILDLSKIVDYFKVNNTRIITFDKVITEPSMLNMSKVS